MEQPTYYAIIPAYVRYDKNLKPNEKLLYWEITCLTQRTWYCFASNKYFSELYWVSKQCVSWWINNLKRKWYIDIVVEYGPNKEIINRYITLNEYPIKEKFNTPIKEKLKGNTTSNNTTSNNMSNDEEKEKEQQNTSYEDKEKLSSKKEKSSAKEEQFEEFWEHYPRKVNKQKAKTLFFQNLHKVWFDKLLDWAKKYAEQVKQKWTEQKFIKHPTTWLNNWCWEDEYDIKDDDEIKKERMVELMNSYNSTKPFKDKYWQKEQKRIKYLLRNW